MKKLFIGLLVCFALCSVLLMSTQAIEVEDGAYIDQLSIQEGYIQEPLSLEEQFDRQLFYSSTNDFDREGAKQALVTAMENYETVVDVSAYNIPYKGQADQAGVQYLLQFVAEVINENPQLFHVRTGWASINYDNESNIVLKFYPYYAFEENDYLSRKVKFDAELENAMQAIQPGMTELEKIIAFHDYLAISGEYDMETYNTQNNKHPTSFTSYGILVEKIGVCQSYTLAFALLCKNAGIEYTTVESRELAHIWNMVKLDNEWYHVDVTWDDPIFEVYVDSADKHGLVSYSSFLKSDAEFTELDSDCDHSASDWIKGNTAAIADSTAFSNAFWTNAHANMARFNGYYYYAIGTPYPTWIVRSSLDNISDHELLRQIENVYWDTDDDSTIKTGLFSVIPFVYGNELYYNTTDSIYKYVPNASADKFMYSFENSYGFIVPVQARSNSAPAFFNVTRAEANTSVPYVYTAHTSPFIPGDANFDMVVNTLDIFTLSRYLNGWYGYADMICLGNSDTNGDMMVNENDIKSLIAMIISKN